MGLFGTKVYKGAAVNLNQKIKEFESNFMESLLKGGQGKSQIFISLAYLWEKFVLNTSKCY